MNVEGLSKEALNVLEIMEEVRTHPDTEKHLVPGKYVLDWLPMKDIVSNKLLNVSEEYKDLITKLNTTLKESLVDSYGDETEVFHELKKAGCLLRTDKEINTTNIFKCPNSNWQVEYT